MTADIGGSLSDWLTGNAGRLTCFVSYARATDRDLVDSLADELRAIGVAAWIDHRRLEPGTGWRDEIRPAILATDAFVLVVSRMSVGSHECMEELRLAHRNGKRVHGIEREQIDRDALPAYLNEVQWTAAPPDRDIGDVAADVKRALSVDREWARVHSRLLTPAWWWDEDGRDPGRLLGAKDLDRVERWRARLARGARPSVTPTQVEFVAASRRALRRRRRARSAVAGVALMLALAVGALTLVLRSDAVDDRNAEASDELAAAAQAAFAGDPALAFLRAREAFERSATAHARATLHRIMLLSRLREALPTTGALFPLLAGAPGRGLMVGKDGAGSYLRKLGEGGGVLRPDGSDWTFAQFLAGDSRLLTVDTQRTVTLWRTGDLRPLGSWPLRQGSSGLRQAGYRSGAVYAATQEGDVEVWHAPSETGPLPRWLAGWRRVLGIGPDARSATVELGDGAPAVVGRDGDRLRLPRAANLSQGVDFSPDGALVAVPVGRRLQVWSIAERRMVMSVPALRSSFTGASDDLVTLGAGGVLRRFGTGDGSSGPAVHGFPSAPLDVSAVDADDTIAIVDDVGTTLWAGRPVLRLEARYRLARRPPSEVGMLAGSRAYAIDGGNANGERTLTIRDVRDGRLLGRARLPGDVTVTRVDPHGRFVATTSSSGLVRLRALDSGRSVQIAGTGVAFSPDGERLFVADGGRLSWYGLPSSRLIDSVDSGIVGADSVHVDRSGSRVVVGDGLSAAVVSVPDKRVVFRRADVEIASSRAPLSGDGKLLALRDQDRDVEIWSLEEGRLLHVLPRLPEVTFAPRGDLLGVPNGNRIELWTALGGERLIGQALGSAAEAVDFASDESTLAVTTAHGDTLFFDCETCRPFDDLLRATSRRIRRPLTRGAAP